jgi:MoaA/NifB/PqqE/SkfB family radical SAM enzyme
VTTDEQKAVHPRALLIAATDDLAAAGAVEALRARMPGAGITAVTRAGSSLTADRLISAAVEGPYGFILTPHLLRELRGGFDLAWAAVGDLSSPAYRRVALLLSLARAKQKAAIGPGGEVVPLAGWLKRAGISLGLLSLLRAAWRRALAPHRRRRAQRLLHGDRPPFGLRRVNIGVSDRCNHRCIMCSEHSPYCADGLPRAESRGGRRMAAEAVLDERDFGLMDPAIYRDLIRDLRAMGCREVELCGLGEPLLHPRLFDFLRQAKAAGLWVRLVTNASLLATVGAHGNAPSLEGNARTLVALGLDEIHISLNAGTPETYAKVHGVAPSVFHRVLAAIRAVAEARRNAAPPAPRSPLQTWRGAEVRTVAPTIETSFVVQADNYREPVEWVRLVANAGVDIITFSALGAAPPGAPVQLPAEQLKEAKANVAAAVELARSRGLEVRGTFGALADSGPAFSEHLYAHMPCYIGHIFALVTASGRIHPCCACERVVGDLKDGGFAKAWRGDPYRRFREECLDLPNRLPGLDGCSCMACPYGPWNVEFHRRLYAG